MYLGKKALNMLHAEISVEIKKLQNWISELENSLSIVQT